MKRLLAAIASSFFALGVSAADIYHGLGDGNSDLSAQSASDGEFVGLQPGVGDSIDIYGGLANGNADLFKADRRGPADSGDAPNITRPYPVTRIFSSESDGRDRGTVSPPYEVPKVSDELPEDYAPRSELEKRVRMADRNQWEPMLKLDSLPVEFTTDFDQFSARVAHGLRRRMIYRSDNGRLARGLVRYSGDLQRIFRRNFKRQPPMQTVVLDVTFIRRKASNPSDRWVIGIRFKENLASFDGDGDRITPSPDIQEKTEKSRIYSFLASAIIATEDMGCKGDRVRSMLEYATKIGYPDNKKLWFYSWRAVYEFVHNLSDEDREKLPETLPKKHWTHGVPIMEFPLKGSLYAPRLRRKLKWRKFPVIDMQYRGGVKSASLRRELEELYDDVHESSKIVADAVGSASHGTGMPMSKYVEAFGEHVADLMKGHNHRKHGEESIYHHFEPACK